MISRQLFHTCIFCEHKNVGVMSVCLAGKNAFNGFITLVFYWPTRLFIMQIKKLKKHSLLI